MKKLCLVLSLIGCLICFAGCKNNTDDVVNPNIPDNTNQEQNGEVLPNEDENEFINPDEELPSEEISGETDAPEVVIPDENEENTTPDEGENLPNDDEVENPEDNNEENVETTTPEASAASNIMTNIVAKAGAEVNMPMQDAITAELSEGMIFLPEADFTKYVADGVFYESMISPAFQSLAIIKVNDTSKIAELKKTILDNSNPRKWLCSSAEKVVVVDCGEYIMLAMSTEDLCNKLVTAFGEQVGAKLGETLTKAGEL